MANDADIEAGRIVAELRRELALRTAERDEALAQLSATAEVLQVINASPGDLAPVFDQIVTKAVALCGATLGSLHLYDGKEFNPVAVDGERRHAERLRQQGAFRPPPGALLDRIARGDRLVHVVDVTQDEAFQASPRLRELVETSGVRAALSVALSTDDRLAGSITVYRREVGRFSDKEIALLQNFAAQAVIAIGNARLITETREALEQQTATAEVLQVNNASPGDLGPVFNVIVEKALTLCGADEGGLRTFDGEVFRLVSVHGGESKAVERLRHLGDIRPPDRSGFFGPLVRGERVVHIHDVRQTDSYRDNPEARERLEIRGIRTWLGVALHKENILLGALIIHRQEVRPFTEKQIALLQNFAAQAVIAMENARLLTETREALEQQTATADVLQVINSSPGNLAPVFDAIVERAMRLCGAFLGGLQTYDGEMFVTVAARGGVLPVGTTVRPQPGFVLERLIRGQDLVHVINVFEDPAYHASSAFDRMVEAGVRSLLVVALRKENVLLGALGIYGSEARPFTEEQIALLQNFAAQAVIAMENARLITETREALEQQTATAEVLEVINASPGDLAPVFDAVLEKALSLCEAGLGVVARFDGTGFHWVSARGITEEQLADPFMVLGGQKP